MIAKYQFGGAFEQLNGRPSQIPLGLKKNLEKGRPFSSQGKNKTILIRLEWKSRAILNKILEK